MLDRLRTWAARPGIQSALDALVVLVLAGTSVASVAIGAPAWGRPLGAGLLLALLSTLPLLWRSRHPVSVFGIVLAANAACVYAAAPEQAAFQPFVALVLAGFSVGSRSDGVRAPLALAVAAAPMFLVSVVVHGQAAGNVIPSYIWLLAAWTIGRIARGLRRQNAELARVNEELRTQRELQAEAAVEVERGRIAREMHDVIAHNVSMMVVQASAASRVPEDRAAVQQALDVIATTGRQTVDEMRTVLGALRGSTLRPQPGLDQLDELVNTMREAGLPVACEVAGTPYTLPQSVDLSAYRIVQEGLTNTLRHAGPATARVSVRYLDRLLELTVADTGAGRSSSAPDGHGLIGMKERVAMLGGDLDVASTPEGGFLIRARLPLHPAVPA